ncbi:hypothetical protein FJZ17_00945 [Candidatus Pacearchaeota archaeon]|nr:hypothetical protein [Candidatus Pacearchaeota archaeon]
MDREKSSYLGICGTLVGLLLAGYSLFRAEQEYNRNPAGALIQTNMAETEQRAKNWAKLGLAGLALSSAASIVTLGASNPDNQEI